MNTANFLMQNNNQGLLSQQQQLANALMADQGDITQAQPANFSGGGTHSIDPQTLASMAGASKATDNDFIRGSNQGGFSGLMNANADSSLPWSTKFYGNNANAPLPWLNGG